MAEDPVDMARRHVAEGERHVSSQRRILEDLRADGHDTAMAALLLKEFESTLRDHRAHLARLLEAPSKPPRG